MPQVISRVRFNFRKFLMDRRLTLVEVADGLNITTQGLYPKARRNMMTMEFFRRMEALYGDLTAFIIPDEQN